MPTQRIRRSLERRADEFLRGSPLLRRWRIDEAVNAEEVHDGSIEKIEIISPADPRVSLGINAHDETFLRECKYYNEGWYSRPNIFTCEVPDGYCHIGTGVVCTRDWKAINDSQMTYRMNAGPALVGNPVHRVYKSFKPRRVARLEGLHSTIGNIYQGYWGHWIFDCLPRLYSLQKSATGRKVTLLIPDNLGPSFRDSLEATLPPNFQLLRLPPNSWIQSERLLMASYPSSRANNHEPREFYDYVRQACFAKFGLPPENRPSERIYVSRAGTRHRRILNEEGLIQLVRRYGFNIIALEKLNFRQQVELFHRAEIIIAADGSNWADMIFAGPIKVFVLYSHHEPNTHWFTAAKGLGQEHYFLKSDAPTQHADFTVDLAAMERILRNEMG